MRAELLKIPGTIVDDMVAHAREGFPLEVCGILGGKEGVASVVYHVTNTEASSRHFLMDPHEQLAAMEKLDEKGLELLAFYHSHPETPAWPSAEDIRLAFYPEVFIVIVCLLNPAEPAIRPFKIIDKKIFPQEIEII